MLQLCINLRNYKELVQHAKMRDRGREKENFILASLNNTR